jgi:large conductance mechanosensitive channel
VSNIIMPLVSYVVPAANYRDWTIGRVEIGLFIAAVINFIVIAFALFLTVVKVRQAITRPKAAAPTTKECPACATEIPAKANRCPHCTSDLSGFDHKMVA